MEPQVIGWQEYVSLPHWGVIGVRAKADTGARSSALDATEIEPIDGDRVRFLIRVQRDPAAQPIEVVTEIARRSRVRSSFGASRERIFVHTIIEIGPVAKRVEVGLVDRGKMICRMLLGRTALQEDFYVDSKRRFLFEPKRNSTS